MLTQESLEKSTGIQKLEEAATQLYKALQAGRDTGEFTSRWHSSLSNHLWSLLRYGRDNGKAQRIQDT
jgi:hypothetical protein